MKETTPRNRIRNKLIRQDLKLELILENVEIRKLKLLGYAVHIKDKAKMEDIGNNLIERVEQGIEKIYYRKA